MLPIDSRDIFCGMTGFVGNDHVFGEIVFVADDSHVEIGGVLGANEVFNTFGFVKVGGDCFGGDANVVLQY